MFAKRFNVVGKATADCELWNSLKGGDRSAYGAIYELYALSLYRYGMHLYQNVDLVEDAIHDLFVTLWETRAKLGEVRSINLYLKSSFRRNLLRKVSKLNKKAEVLEEHFICRFSIAAEDQKVQNERSLILENKLIDSLNSLSARQKEIIYLHFYQDMTYEEIATHLELDLGYIYNIASNAYGKIRKILSGVVKLLTIIAIYLFITGIN